MKNIAEMSFEIIDFHTHPFLEKECYFCIYKESVGADVNTIISDMNDVGISRFCGSVIRKRHEGEGFEVFQKLNRDALKLREIYGEKYIPGIHVHPDFVEESEKEIEYAAQNGVRLIGELVPYMHGWKDYSCRGFSDVLDVAEKFGMVVSLHLGDHDQMLKMASEHKNVNFVVAHPGEKDRVMKHVELMKKCDNVFLDLSGGGMFRYGLVRYLCDAVGAERILFGTDYPICNLKMYVGAIMGERLTDHERELIFSQNAKRLLKL